MLFYKINNIFLSEKYNKFHAISHIINTWDFPENLNQSLQVLAANQTVNRGKAEALHLSYKYPAHNVIKPIFKFIRTKPSSRGEKRQIK